MIDWANSITILYCNQLHIIVIQWCVPLIMPACDGCHQVGEKFLIKGRNLYPNVIEHECKVENFNCVNG